MNDVARAYTVMSKDHDKAINLFIDWIVAPNALGEFASISYQFLYKYRDSHVLRNYARAALVDTVQYEYSVPLIINF